MIYLNVSIVEEIEPNSPAELAGLQPFTDYLLGTAEKVFYFSLCFGFICLRDVALHCILLSQVFKDAEVLSLELRENEDRPVEFYVYNSETDEVRVVVLLPTLNWGGEGKPTY